MNHGRSKLLPDSNPLSVRDSLLAFARRRITGTMGFEPTTVGLEVRRSFRTELRALEYESTINRYKQCGLNLQG